MSAVDPRIRARTRFPHHFVSALRATQLYGVEHPEVHQRLSALLDAVERLLVDDANLIIGIISDAFVVGDHRVEYNVATLKQLAPRLREAGIERMIFRRGVTREELATFIGGVAKIIYGATGDDASLPSQPHISTDRIRVDQNDGESASASGAVRQLYASATAAAGDVWESAVHEGKPAMGAAVSVIAGLAEIIRENRTALLALTAMKQYDQETSAHMVNVAVLTMAQARTLGIDGDLLNELGLAALLHDLGKIRTPLEILTKPEALTDKEIRIMRHHVIDGAEILRSTPDMVPLAPIVAFEHHVRPNGTGYPAIKRPALNVGTMLCSIADVYDAMRTGRRYQDACPTDRILAVLRRSDGGEFDPHLVRRFVQLIGMYPPGSVVRLSTKEIAVVLKAYAPDPYTPQVRVIRDAAGQPVAGWDVRCLWDTSSEEDRPTKVEAPLDPEDYGIDPLMYLGEAATQTARPQGHTI